MVSLPRCIMIFLYFSRDFTTKYHGGAWYDTPFCFFSVERAELYYYNYSPPQWVATPPPSVKKIVDSQCWTEETQPSKIFWQEWGFGAFVVSPMLLFLQKIRAKKKTSYICKVFVVVRMSTFWGGLIVYSI